MTKQHHLGTCLFRQRLTDFLQRQPWQCRDLHAQGIREMTEIAAQAAGTTGFNEKALQNTLQPIAVRARATEGDSSQAVTDGWIPGAQHATQDGILTQKEEDSLRSFRERVTDQDIPTLMRVRHPGPRRGPTDHLPSQT